MLSATNEQYIRRCYPLPMNNTYADAICGQLTIHADLSATKKKEEENAKKIQPRAEAKSCVVVLRGFEPRFTA